MRIGTENKKQLRWMIVLLATAALAVIYDFHGFFKTDSSPQTNTAAHASVLKQPGTPQLDREARLRLDSLLSAQQKVFQIGGRNIFRMQEIEIGSKGPDKSPDRGRPEPTGDQAAPPLPFTFFGFADKRSEPRRVFLQDGQSAFITKVGDIVAGRYKVIEVSRDSVTLEDALSNRQQVVPLLGR